MEATNQVVKLALFKTQAQAYQLPQLRLQFRRLILQFLRLRFEPSIVLLISRRPCFENRDWWQCDKVVTLLRKDL